MAVILGSKFLVHHSVTGLVNQYLTDRTVGISVEYYMLNKYSEGHVTVTKSQMVFDAVTNSNSFSAVVDTTQLSTGTLAALFSITYTNGSGQEIIEKFTVVSDIEISQVS